MIEPICEVPYLNMRLATLTAFLILVVSCQKKGQANGAAGTVPDDSLQNDPVEELAKNAEPLPLSNEQIQTAIDTEMASIAACYENDNTAGEDGTQTDTSTGTVETEFLVMPNGETTDIKTWGMSENLNGCVAEVLGKVRFPTFNSPDPMGVQYPFEFAEETNTESTQ